MFRRIIRNSIVFTLLLCGVESFYAQQQLLPLNREFNLENQKVLNSYENSTHTSFLPIVQSFIQTDTNSLGEYEKDFYLINISKSTRKPRNFWSWIYRTAFFENFLVVDTGDFYLTVDPLLNGEFGQESNDASDGMLYTNTRGIIVRANVGKKFSFESSMYENQAVVPGYIGDFVQQRGIMPGQGRTKVFKENGYDFSSSSANLSYTPAEYINLQLGMGKNFIGEGYRSVLLSDQSFNYPYFKATALFGKKKQFQYVHMNAQLMDLIRREKGSTVEALFQRKSMTTHYFNWNVAKWLSLGFFENTLWQTEDSLGTEPFQYQQLNPLFGVNALTTRSDEAHHSNIGFNTKIKLPFKFILYGQLMYDGHESVDSKATQLGFKYLGLKYFAFQGEYNKKNTSITSDMPSSLENFHHYNEYLAHPFGDDFEEFVGIINFKYKRLFSQIKVNYAKTTSNNDIVVFQTHLGYVINPKNNLSAVVGSTIRREEIAGVEVTPTDYFYFGIRTSLRNIYTDF